MPLNTNRTHLGRVRICGKSTPLKSFNPQVDLSTFGFIQIREGGGRGSGFKFVVEYPLDEVAAHYPEIMEKIRNRINEMNQLLPLSSQELAKERAANQIPEKTYTKFYEKCTEKIIEKIQRQILGGTLDEIIDQMGTQY